MNNTDSEAVTTPTETPPSSISSSCSSSKDILLTSDERYEIWELKCVERPYLIHLSLPPEENANDDDKYDDHDDDDDDDDRECLPLVDGCDLEGWRYHSLMKRPSSIKQGYLNVGTGCHMMRRESQLSSTFLETSYFQQWNNLRTKLLTIVRKPTVNVYDLKSNQDIPNQNDHQQDHHHPQQLNHPASFERDNVPAILGNEYTQHWKAYETCTFDNLLQKWGHYDWRFSDTHGQTITLHTYNKYIHSLEGLLDDAPLAVYDSQLHTDERRSLLKDYDVPKCFVPSQGDLFDEQRLTEDGPQQQQCQEEDLGHYDNHNDGNDDDDDDGNYDESGSSIADQNDQTDTVLSSTFERPPYRWILIGPERSGTGLHIDPLGTHAWVTLIEGLKRWVLFPYGTDPSMIGMQEPQIPSAVWFASDWYGRSLQAVPGAIEIIQHPFETVYVPAGWPHLVLNLELSVAITHNYASEYPTFDRIDRSVQAEEPEMYDAWVHHMKTTRPDLFHENPTESISTIVEEKKDVN